jgi:Glyoxalase-like domain
MRIDHVILATPDLDATAVRLAAEHGLEVVGGGRHEGMGTHNRIVPLGGGYLELLAVADPAEAAASALGSAVQRALRERGEGFIGWAAAVDAVSPVADRLGLEVTTIRRSGLSARLTGVAEALAEPCLPFFIERDPGVADPSAGGDAGGIAWIALAGDRNRLDAWLGEPLPSVRIEPGAAAVRAVGTGSGTVLGEPGLS